MSQTPEQQFRAALAQLIREHTPWPNHFYNSEKVNDAAWAIAEKHAARLWHDMATEAGER